MGADDWTLLRADIAVLRNDVSGIRQDIGVLETKAEALETWRERYLAQEDQVLGKLFKKVDELVDGLSIMRSDIARLRGERDAERRLGVMLISILSAICGALCTSILHGQF